MPRLETMGRDVLVPWIRFVGGPRPAGMSMSVRGYYRHHEEPWVTTAVIGGLLDMGIPPSRMFPEMRVAPGCRPDLVVLPGDAVLVFEAKRERPSSTARHQVRRYIASVEDRWPGLPVLAFLVWPTDGQMHYPRSDREVAIERVAA